MTSQCGSVTRMRKEKNLKDMLFSMRCQKTRQTELPFIVAGDIA
jgi:hypothetical protein